VGDNPFIVVLPDIIIDTASADPLRYNLAAMVARFNETGRSQVLAKRMKGDLSSTRFRQRSAGDGRAGEPHR
jgi:UTP--glucose-1-phosphate uridylyltransferase